MEVSLLTRTSFLTSLPFSSKRTINKTSFHTALCRCSTTAPPSPPTHLSFQGRRSLVGSVLSTALGLCICDIAKAVSTSRRALRGAKIPESEYTTLPNGLKYYDLKVGSGPKAIKGSRVAVHYVAKWKNITFMTSRQGLGVGGGTRMVMSCED